MRVVSNCPTDQTYQEQGSSLSALGMEQTCPLLSLPALQSFILSPFLSKSLTYPVVTLPSPSNSSQQDQLAQTLCLMDLFAWLGSYLLPKRIPLNSDDWKQLKEMRPAVCHID